MIYEIINGHHIIETDRKPVVIKEVRRLEKKGLREGKDFFVRRHGGGNEQNKH